jgi:diguanylate cyclase (GGDEF)-like protein
VEPLPPVTPSVVSLGAPVDMLVERRTAPLVSRRGVRRLLSAGPEPYRPLRRASGILELIDLAADSLPDPLSLLSATCRTAGAAAAEITVFDGRTARWSTEPGRVLDGEPTVVSFDLRFEGEVFGLLSLLPQMPFEDHPLDREAAEVAAGILGMSFGSVKLSARLAAELDDHEHALKHDLLTGMANRVAFDHAVERALSEVARGVGSIQTGGASQPNGAALVVLDLNRFKEVNAGFGHAVGDLVVAEIADRLSRSMPEHAIAARIGGDSFAVLLHGVADVEEAFALGVKLLQALDGPIEVEGAALHVNTAMGIAFAPEHGVTRSVLAQRADMALYAAKEHPESTLRLWEPSQDRVSSQQLELVVDLRDAIDQGSLEVHYQPKTNIATDSVIGVEALVRWKHPIRGWVRPDEMIPLAEHTGLIHDLTWFVLHTALAQCARWQRSGLPLHVAVNLPARSLRDPNLPQDVSNALQMSGLAGKWLTLEITESEFTTDSDVSRVVMAGLRELGVRLSIDDFGTGYSALSYLARLHVDELKIDKSFVTNLHDNDANLSIVRAIIDVAQGFGLETVAEGVEDQVVLDRLSVMGCTTAQGYLLSPPLAADPMSVWLVDRASKDRARSSSYVPSPAGSARTVSPLHLVKDSN